LVHVASFSSIEIAGKSGEPHALPVEITIDAEQPLPAGASHAQGEQEGESPG
jgi:hypothetical protein